MRTTRFSEHASGRIEITSQNHGFVVDEESLEGTAFVATHTNLNDMTNAGIASDARRAFGVQYHPEAAPGPHDAQHLFARFRALIEGSAGHGRRLNRRPRGARRAVPGQRGPPERWWAGTRPGIEWAFNRRTVRPCL